MRLTVRTPSRRHVGAALVLLAATLLGCSMLPTVNMHAKTETRDPDGTVHRSEVKWSGRIDQLPEGLVQVSGQLTATTAQLIKVLTAVPPPGRVVLGDLGPGLAHYQGRAGADFLINAKHEDGTPIDFQYVRLGVPTYDAFFRQAQVVHATCVQLVETQHQLVQLSSTLLAAEVDADAELHASVSKALQLRGSANVDASAITQLETATQVSIASALLAVNLVGAIQGLVSSGTALVAGAQASLTNPKVLTHLGLVKQGLGDSISVIGGSAELMGKLATSFNGFAMRAQATKRMRQREVFAGVPGVARF